MENRLEEIRKARGIKQEDLALELGVSRQTIILLFLIFLLRNKIQRICTGY